MVFFFDKIVDDFLLQFYLKYKYTAADVVITVYLLDYAHIHMVSFLNIFYLITQQLT